MTYVQTISGRNPIFAAFFENSNRALRLARTAGHVIVLEALDDGVKKYIRSTSIFGDPPVTNPLAAHNYALNDERADWDRRPARIDDDFNDLWRDCSTFYVKNEGGAKSGIRSDVPGQVVIFDKEGVEQLRLAFPTVY